MGDLMNVQDILDSLKSRILLIDEFMSEYDTSDPDFEDTYSEGRYDTLWDQRCYLFDLIVKIESTLKENV